MVCGTARLSAAAWTGMVCPVRHAGLSAVGDISVVVSLRSLRARGFRQGRDDRRRERLSRLRVRHRRVAMARAPVAACHHIRSQERRVGNERVSNLRTQVSLYLHNKKNKTKDTTI